ncbi:phasin family protein [Sphingomonas sp. SUN039]|uniref:phasin family protein n=1 Tax=Sphingomonas sp. SUN039 TaxID=2937787 RepID=UPI0021649E5B|nr:phasin family protein [Sphingomonas sp. SUN039]UVO55266.1 phasin family protein [Sphingomonas sp. SUN039]
MAKVPTSKKPVTKALKPVVTAAAKPVAAAPAVAKNAPVPAKPVAAKPVVAAVVAPKPVEAAPVVVRKVEPAKIAETAKVEAVKAETPAVELPKVEAVKVETVVTEPKIETPAAAPVEAAAPVKGPTMTDTVKSVAEDMQNRATAMFGDVNARAKDAMSKGTKAIEELVEFSKGNVEALVASGRVAAKGAEDIAKYSAEYGRTSVEKANATAKQFAAVKSPTEFFQLQGDVAKQTLDALVAEGSKFTENYLKLLGEIAQPISNRVAVAAEKVKTTVAA